MNRIKQVSLALATAGMLASGVAQAGLESRAGGTMLYDNVLKITWLADANYAKTSGYDADGRMNWSVANSWAANLLYGGYDDWRLPTGSGPCAAGSPCAHSEMGHMYFSNNLALVTNLQSDVYWSGTAYAPVPGVLAWQFDNYFGVQSVNSQTRESYAWAVRPGDVAAPIPEPETCAMLLAGLGLLGVVAKRRRRFFGAS